MGSKLCKGALFTPMPSIMPLLLGLTLPQPPDEDVGFLFSPDSLPLLPQVQDMRQEDMRQEDIKYDISEDASLLLQHCRERVVHVIEYATRPDWDSLDALSFFVFASVLIWFACFECRRVRPPTFIVDSEPVSSKA